MTTGLFYCSETRVLLSKCQYIYPEDIAFLNGEDNYNNIGKLIWKAMFEIEPKEKDDLIDNIKKYDQK